MLFQEMAEVVGTFSSQKQDETVRERVSSFFQTCFKLEERGDVSAEGKAEGELE